MKQIVIKKGNALSIDVPIPSLESNQILVKVKSSCLSIGTESNGLKGSSIPLWRRALNSPKKVVDVISSHGTKSLINKLKEKNAEEATTGYSASGVIVKVGSQIKDLSVGDFVACSGGLYAYHAEYICIPRNLVNKIPKDVEFESAATVTLGAIALQGIRRAKPTLGETFVVIGLGFIGQLSVQILGANGCQVIGIDTDKKRIDLASSMGMHRGIHPDELDKDLIRRLTNGYGADGIIITAASSSSEIISSAFNMCRKKGRVVLVGDVGLNLRRSDFYAKELDFFISTSYGPGRYDGLYEEEGLDYPIGYVRWTENRNMEAYLKLIQDKKVDVLGLAPMKFKIEEATEAYDAIKKSEKPLFILLNYTNNNSSENDSHTIIFQHKNPKNPDIIKVALIGVGTFARTVHLPNLHRLKNKYHLRALVSRTGPTAKVVGTQYNVDYITTNYQEVLSDESIDSVIISTRHHLHGSLTLKALQARKHVLVEKPLTLSQDELMSIQKFYVDEQNSAEVPILMTGYNRRFSIYARRMKEIIENRTAPFILNYKMNAGYIPMDHWVHGNEGGGRNLGEACHIYDLFTFLSNSKIKTISAHAIQPTNAHYTKNDNFIASMSFEDGSIASLTYTALGNKQVPKEIAELYVDGKIIYLDDYKSMKIYKGNESLENIQIQDKGSNSELLAFAEGINKGEWAIPLWQQIQTSEIGFTIEKILSEN